MSARMSLGRSRREANMGDRKESRWRWKQALDARREKKRIKRLKASGWVGNVTCPKCRREVRDVERQRNAHRQSCVRIPRKRPAGWGVRDR